MPELLLEVGCEELPATFVRRAYEDLRAKLTVALAEAGLLSEGAPSHALGTPRRLIVAFPEVAGRQADRTERSRGPALTAAFDAEGKPTKALEGFCRKAGVDPASAENDGQYVWIERAIPGRPAAEILAEILPKTIRSLTFEKSMRWGNSRLRFARPIRWLLATLGGETVPFDIEGVASGNRSRGHRFYAPGEFEATSFDGLLAGLRERRVEPDPAERERLIRDGAAAVASGSPDLPDALVDENVFLTEWPTAIEGTFPDDFLDLPEPVLVTAMAKHERMFPVRGADGRVAPRFVFVRNSGEDESVRRGCEWVLNARFNDARFFFAEDKKSSLDDFLERTSRIVFQEKLGTVRARADRLAALAARIAEESGASAEEVEHARRAGLYAKADLATGLVSELSSLQGVIGGAYARREGFPGEVAWAIETQYDPSKNPDPASCAGERTSLRLAMADALDKLAGYLGLGLEPTGSSDPYGLRRAVTVLIEAAWAWPGALPPFDALFEDALKGYADQGITLDGAPAQTALADLFAARYSALLPEARHDVLEAALLRESRWEATLPQGVLFRTRALAALASDDAFVSTAKRPMNLVVAARRKGIAYAFEDPLSAATDAGLDSAEGVSLRDAVRAAEDPAFRAAREGDVAGLEAILRDLAPRINAFVDGAMVMAEDESTRHARLSLMHATALVLLRAGDFTKLEG